MRTLRAGLILLTVVEAALAAALLVFTRSFFAFSWVNMHMSYNEHLLLDFGAANLAFAVLLAVAAVTLRPPIVRTALLVLLVFSAGHLIIHIRYVGHLPPAESAVLLSGLAVAALLPAGLLALTRAVSQPPG